MLSEVWGVSREGGVSKHQPRRVLFVHIRLTPVWEEHTYHDSHSHAGRNIDSRHIPCHEPNLAPGGLADRPTSKSPGHQL